MHNVKSWLSPGCAMKKPRRKYDSQSIQDQLLSHEEHDDERFTAIDTKLGRVERAVYGLYIALALFAFLIEHPQIISNLSSPARAETMLEVK